MTELIPLQYFALIALMVAYELFLLLYFQLDLKVMIFSID